MLHVGAGVGLSQSERNHGLFVWGLDHHICNFFKSFTIFFISIGRADENIEVEEIRKKMKSIRLRAILYIYISESFVVYLKLTL